MTGHESKGAASTLCTCPVHAGAQASSVPEPLPSSTSTQRTRVHAAHAGHPPPHAAGCSNPLAPAACPGCGLIPGHHTRCCAQPWRHRVRTEEPVLLEDMGQSQRHLMGSQARTAGGLHQSRGGESPLQLNHPNSLLPGQGWLLQCGNNFSQHGNSKVPPSARQGTRTAQGSSRQSPLVPGQQQPQGFRSNLLLSLAGL